MSHSSLPMPLVTLHTPATWRSKAVVETVQPKALSAVCFLPDSASSTTNSNNTDDANTNANAHGSTNNNSDDDDDSGSSSSSSIDDDNDEYDPTMSQCAQLSLDNTESSAMTSRMSLAGRKVAACSPSGELLIWDIHQQSLLHTLDTGRPFGLTLRRLSDTDTHTPMLYQTRDPLGTVSIHDPQGDMKVVNQWHTRSLTFCAAVPCHMDPHLIIVPSGQNNDEAHVTIHDIRASPHEQPAYSFSAVTSTSSQKQKCGMLMSLASMKYTNDDNHQHPHVVACGMENGQVHLHDLTMSSNSQERSSMMRTSSTSSMSLGTDPVLSLDMAASVSTAKTLKHNDNSHDDHYNLFVMVAGLGGDSAELEKIDKSQRGRVAVVKGQQLQQPQNSEGSKDDNNKTNALWKLRVRARVGIGQESPTVHKKSGVSIARFRPGDGRLFAIGGWDRRLRIYDRKGSTPLAVLKGQHEGSVDALDWAADAASSGLLATGSSDGVLHIWKCFGTE